MPPLLDFLSPNWLWPRGESGWAAAEAIALSSDPFAKCSGKHYETQNRASSSRSPPWSNPRVWSILDEGAKRQEPIIQFSISNVSKSLRPKCFGIALWALLRVEHDSQFVVCAWVGWSCYDAKCFQTYTWRLEPAARTCQPSLFRRSSAPGVRLLIPGTFMLASERGFS